MKPVTADGEGAIKVNPPRPGGDKLLGYSFSIMCTDVSVGQRYGLHEVDSLGVDLDEGENVSSLHGVAQRVKPRRRIGTLLPCETLLCVFGCDEVFPRLPGGGHEEEGVN